MIITDHAYERAKEKLFLDKKDFNSFSENAFKNGVNRINVNGKLRKYLDKLYYKENGERGIRDIKIYGRGVFVFSRNILITVFLIPKSLTGDALFYETKNR